MWNPNSLVQVLLCLPPFCHVVCTLTSHYYFTDNKLPPVTAKFRLKSKRTWPALPKILDPVGIPLMWRLRHQPINLVLQTGKDQGQDGSLEQKCHRPQTTTRHEYQVANLLAWATNQLAALTATLTCKYTLKQHPHIEYERPHTHA